MNSVLTPDICIIGAGAGGLTAAASAAALGVSVVLIEKGRMGGARLNAGCAASKALVSAARQAHAIRAAAAFGIDAGAPKTDFSAVMDHVRGVTATLEPNDSVERLGGLGVTVLKGAARFIDSQTVTVEDTNVRARRFVIAIGSRPAIPAIPNLGSVPYLTSETIFDLTRLPGRLVIIGAGSVGLEMAQAFRRLGSEVTVLEAEQALADDDPELVALLVENLRGEGIDIREGVTVTRVARRGRTGVRLTLEGANASETFDATHLLIAVGRRPDLSDLGLKEGGIRFDERGIRVNRRMRTRNRRVYAIGEVTDSPHFAHWAAHQGELVVRSIVFRFGGRPRRDVMPWVTFTDPELAHVGLSEKEAARRLGRLNVLRWPFSENDRAHAERATRGFVKVLADRRGRIVGAEILGRDAGELIAPFVLAVSNGMNVRNLATAVFPYPTRAEAARSAAVSLYARELDSPRLRWWTQLLRRFR